HGQELFCLREEDRSAEADLEHILSAQRELRQAVLDATAEAGKEQALYLLRQIARWQVCDRLAELETDAALELVTAVLKEALTVLPDEPALLVYLSGLLARQQCWTELYPVLSHARQLDLTPELRGRLTALERHALAELRGALPESIGEEDSPEV